MNKVLFVGNGFDLAHGLLTKYEHFLEVIKNWDEIYQKIIQVKQQGTVEDDCVFYRYVCNASKMDVNNLDKLDRIIKDNSWINYYKNCEAEIDGWIDFEREIYPVIQLFETIFGIKDYKITKSGEEGYGKAYINSSYLNSTEQRIAVKWGKYLGFNTGLHVKAPYVSRKYGILKKKILKSLRDEFDEFIKAFEIYLLEFVNRVEHTEVLKQIKDINLNYVISCNYTKTEALYRIAPDKVHHLHGIIRDDIKEDDKGKNSKGEKNNIVVGVNEQEEQNMDFIYFVKYFQRIQKESGTKYKEFINQRESTPLGSRARIPYELHIYGHSLDETDEDILKYLIGDKDEESRLIPKPEKVIIYYYDEFDYEQKVINLIKLYGRSIVEKYMENGKFFFVLTNATKCVI